MDQTNGRRPTHDPLAASLTTADDRGLLNHWMPPQSGIIPRIRFGSRWYNTLGALPIAFVLIVVNFVIGQTETVGSESTHTLLAPSPASSAYSAIAHDPCPPPDGSA